MNTTTQVVSAEQFADKREARSIILDRLVKIEGKYHRAKLLITELEACVQTSSAFLAHIRKVYTVTKEISDTRELLEEESSLMKEFLGELDGFIVILKQDLRIT